MGNYKEYWIEHKLFIDEMIYEAYETNDERVNKDLIPIHVIEIQAVEDLEAKLERLAELAGTLIDLIISFPCDKQIENGNETHFENCRRCKAIKSYHMRETMSNRKQGE